MRATLRRLAPYFFASCALAAIYVLLGHVGPKRVGDGSEYYALFYAWYETHRPWMSAVSFDAYAQLHDSNRIVGLFPRESLEEAFPALKVGLTSDFNHFWFYSFLAAEIARVAAVLSAPIMPHSAFLLLHLCLLTFAAAVGIYVHRWQGLIAFSIMTIGSPMLWFFDKVHTELFTYSLTLPAVILIYSKRYLLGSFLLALASMQNPSFALVAAIPLIYRVAFQRSVRYKFLEVCLISGTVLAVLAHPFYYFFRLGVFTPQLLAGGASLGGKLSSFYIWLLDPDLGLFPNWPLGLAILLLSVTLWALAVRCREGKVVQDKFFTVFVTAFLLVNFYAHSSTTNLNSGATPGLARYALWYLPLMYPVLIYAIDGISSRRLLAYPAGTLCLILCLYSIWQSDPRRNEGHTHPTVLSMFIQTAMPSLYDPPPEVFAERYSGAGELINFIGPRAVVGPDCRKLLIYPGKDRGLVTEPINCMLDKEKVRLMAESLLADAGAKTGNPFYTNIAANEADRLRLIVARGANAVGNDAVGNFILGSGWSTPEHWGVWSESKLATLVLPCNEGQYYYGSERIRVSVRLQPFGRQEVEIRQSGATLARHVLDGTGTVEFYGRVDHCRSNLIEFDIAVSSPRSPLELGQSADARKLGVGLTEFKVD